MTIAMDRAATAGEASLIDSPYAWFRLSVSLVLSTIGGVGLWSVVVALTAVQAEFQATRADASLPYTASMILFAFGGILWGRVVDRMGIVWPAVLGTLMLGGGYILAGYAETLWQFTLVHSLLIGFLGSSVIFGPLIADISHWFDRRRGIAVAICASGNYLAGTLWPKVVEHFISTSGWRTTYIYIGIFCLLTMLPLILFLRRPPPRLHNATATPPLPPGQATMSPGLLQFLLLVAGFSCCVAMGMPQVHIVAYCADLGYGVARGAEMLAIMLGTGVISRLGFGWISDRIGGAPTLLIGSALQALTLALYIPFDGLASLYLVSALFGLSQGGIVPAYAIIIRERFPAAEAGGRIGLVLWAALIGMAVGGWMSGWIFDLTQSYRVAFINGVAWNMLNLLIALWLWRGGRSAGPQLARA